MPPPVLVPRHLNAAIRATTIISTTKLGSELLKINRMI
jgi:hypothetical protein